MTDDVSKLPAWPEKPRRLVHEAFVYHMEMADAYRAEVEEWRQALKKRLEQWRKHMRHVVTEEELAEVDALLAACERNGGEG